MMFNFMLKSSCTQLELPIYTNSRTKEMWLVSFNIDIDDLCQTCVCTAVSYNLVEQIYFNDQTYGAGRALVTLQMRSSWRSVTHDRGMSSPWTVWWRQQGRASLHLSPKKAHLCLLTCLRYALPCPSISSITIESCIKSWFTFQNTQVSFIMNVVFVCEVVPHSRLSAVIDEWHVHHAGKHWLKSCDNQNHSMWLHELLETYWQSGSD